MAKPLNTITFIIRHGVRTTVDDLYGAPTGFPESGYLSSRLIGQIVQSLLVREVARYEDGLYHGEISPLGLKDILGDMSEYEAVKQGFTRLETKLGSDKQLFALGMVRWEVHPSYKQVRVFGPRSSPDNIVIVDLTQGKGDAA